MSEPLPFKGTTTKKTLQEVAEIVEIEGVAYAVSEYLGADKIEDATLAREWAKAKSALDTIEKILEPYVEY